MANFVKLNGYDVEDTIAREKINNIGNYSTTEVDTGKTWIDGKTIYRKVIATGDLATDFVDNAKSINHGITNLDNVISINCIGVFNDGAKFDFEGYTYYDSVQQAWNVLNVYINTDSIYLTYKGPTMISNVDSSFIILEYTKSN